MFRILKNPYLYVTSWSFGMDGNLRDFINKMTIPGKKLVVYIPNVELDADVATFERYIGYVMKEYPNVSFIFEQYDDACFKYLKLYDNLHIVMSSSAYLVIPKIT